ncbi:MAG TPA: signal recognition particle-docking protein FtsY [Pseudoxanthomonas sp.]|nr:signal recognition particle-docking protein FtsY [Pseudoxanthomonas sp.]
MVSFFRRNSPDDASDSNAGKTRRYTIEELAAAFPEPLQRAPAEAGNEAGTEAETTQTAEAASSPAAPPDAVPVEPEVPPGGSDAAALAPSHFPQPAPPSPPTMPSAPSPADALIEAFNARQEEAARAAVASDQAQASTGPAPAAAGRSGWRERLRGTGFALGLGGLFSRNPKLDEDLLEEIETALLTADVGVPATAALVNGLRKRMNAREFADAQALLRALRAELLGLLAPVAIPLAVDAEARPFVVLTVGVNGVGKTTTIGKLARRFKDEGRSLMLAAGDTFRAAAVAQLQAWGERNGVPVVAQGQDADAASVAFDALQAAKARGMQVLIADTAGRLHTQQGLMAELGKIRRVLGKLDAAAPHEVLMVIDGTTGQNALSQLRQFHAAVGVTGLVVTKLDGTAKGGVVFALAREFGIPIRFAGIGERPEDLRVFDAEAFVDALLPEALGA